MTNFTLELTASEMTVLSAALQDYFASLNKRTDSAYDAEEKRSINDRLETLCDISRKFRTDHNGEPTLTTSQTAAPPSDANMTLDLTTDDQQALLTATTNEWFRIKSILKTPYSTPMKNLAEKRLARLQNLRDQIKLHLKHARNL